MMKNSVRRILGLVVFFWVVIGLSGVSKGYALPYAVNIDTSSLFGILADIAFDLVSNDAASNLVSITNFATDGILGSSSSTPGSVSGSLPGDVTLSDVGFFNELLQGITLGDRISFFLEVTENSPSDPLFPDQFSLFLLDPATGVSLVTTSDPTGADALFAIDITGASFGRLSTYHSMAQVSPVPEPTTLFLFGSGLAGLYGFHRRIKRARPVD